MGIDSEAIGIYLPHSCLRMLNTRTYVPWASSFVDWISIVWDHLKDITARLNGVETDNAKTDHIHHQFGM